jgi:hypothetical protein
VVWIEGARLPGALSEPTGVRTVKKSVAIEKVILQEHTDERNNG